MAAAAVVALAPIGAELLKIALPKITPLVTSLITHAEALFGAKTGPTKFQSVLDAATPFINALSASGKIPGTLDGVSVGTIIETIVQDLKSKNLLDPSSVIPSIAPTSTNTQGTSVKLTGTLILG
jgi:hypothetical protein